MSLSPKRLLRPMPLRAAAALLGLTAATVQPGAASGGFTPGKQLRCSFSLRAPGPGPSFSRRLQELRLAGSCNHPARQVPAVFFDGTQLDVDGQGVTNRFRCGGGSSIVNTTVGRHTLEAVAPPRDPSIQPFVSPWTVFAR